MLSAGLVLGKFRKHSKKGALAYGFVSALLMAGFAASNALVARFLHVGKPFLSMGAIKGIAFSSIACFGLVCVVSGFVLKLSCETTAHVEEKCKFTSKCLVGIDVLIFLLYLAVATAYQHILLSPPVPLAFLTEPVTPSPQSILILSSIVAALCCLASLCYLFGSCSTAIEQSKVDAEIPTNHNTR